VLRLLAAGLVGAILAAVVVLALDDDDPAARSEAAAGASVEPQDPADDASEPEVDADVTDPGSDPSPQIIPPSGQATPPTGDISGEEVACPPASVPVSSAEALQDALDKAQPGDSIGLEDGTYTGAFVAKASGTAEAPVFLCGGPGAVLDGDGIKAGYVFHLDGAQHWRLVGFTVRNGQKGVVADGTTGTVIQGLTVTEIGDEGIHLRSASTANAVLGNTVTRTGLRRDKFGEGIYIGSAVSNWEKYAGGQPDRSDGNLVQGNSISQTTSEAIDVKEGTTGGKVVGNMLDGAGVSAADSLIDVKGNEWLVQGNTVVHAPKEAIQTHHIVDDWGSRNEFRQNILDVDGGGDHFYIHDADSTGNKVFCDNRTGDGGPVKANVDCIS
jgi:hypothetical protein